MLGKHENYMQQSYQTKTKKRVLMKIIKCNSDLKTKILFKKIKTMLRQGKI